MTGNGSTPLLEAVVGGEGGRRKRWWKRVVDEEETKRQVLLLLPMIITNVSYYCITLVSVMFAGHLGQLELAGATLANSWATVTGFAFLTGLSGALETLCGQGFGAKLYRMLGIHLQASCLISCFFSVVISIFWFYSQPILILFHQDPHISKTAAIYMKYLIPGLFAYGFLQNILRFLQTQSVVMPLILFSVLPVGIHFGIIYAMVHWAALGFKAAALAASISLWISTISLALYVLSAKKFQQTWEGFSSESFYYIVTTLKLALPSAAMFCLEDWAFEILVFLAGLMPNSEITTSLTAMCVNTQAIAYMFTYGISSAASTRVSNELGAGNPERAKNAMKTTLMLSLLIAVGVILSLVFGHSIWAGFFSDSPIIAREFASMMPFLAISVALDSVAGVISGVARGCGWQHLGVYANLAMFYLIGTPVAGLLAFKLKLYAKGLWMGLICGLFCQASTLLLITFCRNWSELDLSVKAGKSVKSEEEELGEGGEMFPSSITPLLEADHGEEEDRRRSWWKRVLDVEVAKNQILFSLSVILSNVFYSCITVVSIMFAGHLGELELAGATLANSWATVTGFAIMTGLSEGLETLCGQGYGARLYRMLGIHLQASCIISFFFSVAISILWFYTEPILIFLHQDPEISQATALYLKYLIPGLFAFGLLENLLRFLQTQSVVLPVILFSVIPLCIHLIIVYFFIHHTALGLKGASLAASISLWISIFLLVFYVIYEKKFEHTWEGFSSESFWYILTNLKLALPNAALVCLEDWASEILVFLAGLMPNPKITTSLTAMCVNTQAIAFMLTYGVSSAASTRVSNELGAGNPDRAKTAMTKALKLSVLLAVVVILSLVFGHNAWAGCFGDSPTITREFTSMTPLLAISIALDSVAGVISGVARGCGWQHLALYTNLATFYLVGMPLAGLLAFTLKLYAKGLWTGLICGLFCQASTLFLVLICRNWTKLDLIESGSKETTSVLAA